MHRARQICSAFGASLDCVRKMQSRPASLSMRVPQRAPRLIAMHAAKSAGAAHRNRTDIHVYQSRRDYNVRHGRCVRRCAARHTSLCAASTHMIQQSSGLSARTGGSVLNFKTIARRRWSKKSTLVPTSLQLSRRHRAVARRGVGSDSAVPTRVRGSSAQLDRRVEERRAAPSHSGAVSVLRRNRKPEVHTHGCHNQAGHGRAGS